MIDFWKWPDARSMWGIRFLFWFENLSANRDTAGRCISNQPLWSTFFDVPRYGSSFELGKSSASARFRLGMASLVAEVRSWTIIETWSYNKLEPLEVLSSSTIVLLIWELTWRLRLNLNDLTAALTAFDICVCETCSKLGTSSVTYCLNKDSVKSRIMSKWVSIFSFSFKNPFLKSLRLGISNTETGNRWWRFFRRFRANFPRFFLSFHTKNEKQGENLVFVESIDIWHSRLGLWSVAGTELNHLWANPTGFGCVTIYYQVN